MDTLSLLLSRFAISAGVFYTGSICGVHPFDGDPVRGHLHLIERGPIELTNHQGRTLKIAEPTILFLPRPQRHTLVADDTQGAKVLCATVQFGVGNNNPISSSLPELVAVKLADVQGAGFLLELVAQEVTNAEPGGQAAVDRICELLIIRLLRHCLAAGLTTGGTLAAISDSRLAKAVAAIHQEPTRPWDLVHMAAEAGMSRARFALRFRQVTGQTPADYLASWRITIAQHLLKSGRAMKQVSLETGYGSSSAFTRAFVRKVGVPPSRWLKELEAGGAAVSEDTRRERLEPAG